jgi:D-glycero-alpha-D-manno-heptose 1-phosphate guanylyltransferase
MDKSCVKIWVYNLAQLRIKKAIILAGGRGTRLQSTVPNLPKPMAPVGGRPFLEYVLDRLVDAAVTDIILSVGYRAETIQEHFGASYRSVALRYSIEKFPLGTGGGLVLGLKGEDPSPVLVLNGDTLVEVDYGALAGWYNTVMSPVGVVLCQVPDVSRYGSVICSGDRVVEFKEKGKNGPGLINAGIYVIRPSIFSLYPCGERFSFETDFLERYCSDLQPRSFVTDGYFIDIGTPEDYHCAQRELRTLMSLKIPSRKSP